MHTYDITAISETWLSGDAEKDKLVCSDLTPQGFKLEVCSRSKGKGEGVAILYKTSLKCKRQTIQLYKSFDCLELVLSDKANSVHVCAIYKPPSSSKHGQTYSDFIQEFEHYMSAKVATKVKLLVL